MNSLDFAVLGLILLLAVRGYFRGFFRELFGLAAWAGAGIAAYLLGPSYGPFVAERYRLPIAIGEGLAAIALFVALVLTCQIVGWILSRIARMLFLGPVDRVLGLFVGAAKAVAMATLFCMLVTSRRGLPEFSERVRESPMLSQFTEEGWNTFAIARDYSGLNPSWQHPYSKREIEAREALNRFLTPKPGATPSPAPQTGGERP